jgi:hypothetical protein
VETDESALDEPRYIQIDLHILETIEEFHWALFYYSHGDLISIFKNMLRPFNLDMGRKGLYLRMPELDENQEVLVTREPGHVLRLLGYEPASEIWETEFESATALFEFAAQCRFFTGFAGIELKDEDSQIIPCKCQKTPASHFVREENAESCS